MMTLGWVIFGLTFWIIFALFVAFCIAEIGSERRERERIAEELASECEDYLTTRRAA